MFVYAAEDLQSIRYSGASSIDNHIKIELNKYRLPAEVKDFFLPPHKKA